MTMRAAPAAWYSFESELGDVATDTTLAAATRHEFPQITVRIPELESRTFKSVIALFTWQDVFTVATTVSSWRIGIQAGLSGWTDVDLTESIGNTGAHDSGCFAADVTSFVQSNFGATAEQTFRLAFAMATSVAASIRNLSARLIFQYEHDDESAGNPITEIVRTIHIPFHSHHDRLTNSLVEVGTVAGSNNAPANQFPDLDDWLPPGATIRDIWVEAQCFTGDQSAGGTTDFQLFMQIDNETEHAGPVFEQAMGNGIWFLYLRKLGLAEFSYTSPHSIKYRHSLAAETRFPSLGGMIRVTYTVNPVGLTWIVNSLIMPMPEVDSEPIVHADLVVGPEAYKFDLDIQEPGDITLMQSAAVLHGATASTVTLHVRAHTQLNRTYNQSWGSETSGGHTFHHRIDHGGGDKLTKTSAANVWGDSGASSVQRIPSGSDGYVEFLIPDGNQRIVGLSSDDPDQDYLTVEYGMHTNAGTLYVRENGVIVHTNTHATGDKGSIRRTGTTIEYLKNGAVIYTSAVASSGDLYVDVAINTGLAHVTGLRLFVGGVEQVLTWTNVVAVTVESRFVLARGANSFVLYVTIGSLVLFTITGITVVVNYKSGVHADGPHVHAGTRVWHNRSPAVGVGVSAQSVIQETDPQNKTPVIPEANYQLMAVGIMTHNRKLGSVTSTLSCQRLAGEFGGSGWSRHFIANPSATDIGNHDFHYNLTGDFNRDPSQTGKMNVETARDWRRYASSTYIDFRYWMLTYRTLTYEVSGQVTNYSGDGSGITVDIFNASDERVATTTTIAGGTFTATVYDDTILHYAVARQSASLRGRSDDFTPGVGTVTIPFHPDITAPVITILDPPNGTAVGPSTRIKFRITDNVGFRRQLPMFRFPTAEDPDKYRYELIHDGEAFTPDYEGTRTAIAGGFEFEVGRKGGWSATISYQGIQDGKPLQLIPFAYDTGGNEQP